MATPVEIAETIIDIDKESTVVADEETTGVSDKHTGVETSDNRESTGVLNTEDDKTAAIDSAIMEVAARLDQELREKNAEPE